MSEPVSFEVIALALLVAKEAITLAGKAIGAARSKNGKNSPSKVERQMAPECRAAFNRIERLSEAVHDSVVAPDKQPMHLIVGQILKKVTKEAD